MTRSKTLLGAVALLLPLLVGFGPADGQPTLEQARQVADSLAALETVDGVVISGPGGGAPGGGYTTPVTAVTKGATLTLYHADAWLHDVVCTDKGPDGKPLCKSPLIGLGQSAEVAGVPELPAGQYEFYCSLHTWMVGTLVVQEDPTGSGGEPDPDPNPAGLDWTVGDGDLTNNRHRAADGPTVDEVLNLAAAWTYETSGDGDFPATPVVGDGRVFAGTSAGRAIALDEATGDELWKVDLNTADETAAITASAAYHDGVAYFPVSATTGEDATPYVIALDAATGTELWRTPTDPAGTGGALDGSPTVWTASRQSSDGTIETFEYLIVGTSAADPAAGTHSASVLALDLADAGSVAWRTPVAGGVTTTPAVDEPRRTVYVGAGSSVVALDAFGGAIAAETDAGGDVTSSPQLIEGPGGERWIGLGHADGRYQVLDRTDLTSVWAASVGVTDGFLGTTAHDGQLIVGTLGSGQQVALNEVDGSVAWVAPTGDVPDTHLAPTTVANGVAYTVDAKGLVHAWDAATGVERWIGQVASGPTSGGIAVVGDTVFVARGLDTTSGSITAFRVP